MNFIAKAVSANTRSLALRSFTTSVSWTDMATSKHDFVHFVKTAVEDKSSAESQELYNYLLKCFVDNDSDYDGLVSYKGFNNMVHEAALAPRRFGFAPHTRELYTSKEQFESERTKMFNELTGGNERLSLEQWVGWAMPHIAAKAKGLAEHRDARWERSAGDFSAFVNGVAAESSTNCKRSSSSTQFKEFYMLNSDLFVACDSNKDGCVDEADFQKLVEITSAIPARFGHDGWFSGASYSELAGEGGVTWVSWLNYTLGVYTSKAGSV